MFWVLYTLCITLLCVVVSVCCINCALHALCMSCIKCMLCVWAVSSGCFVYELYKVYALCMICIECCINCALHALCMICIECCRVRCASVQARDPMELACTRFVNCTESQQRTWTVMVKFCKQSNKVMSNNSEEKRHKKRNPSTSCKYYVHAPPPHNSSDVQLCGWSCNNKMYPFFFPGRRGWRKPKFTN